MQLSSRLLLVLEKVDSQEISLAMKFSLVDLSQAKFVPLNHALFQKNLFGHSKEGLLRKQPLAAIKNTKYTKFYSYINDDLTTASFSGTNSFGGSILNGSLIFFVSIMRSKNHIYSCLRVISSSDWSMSANLSNQFFTACLSE